MSILPNLIHSQCKPKTLRRLYVENNSPFLNCTWKCKKPRIASYFKKQKCWCWTVLVCSGCPNKIPETGWLKQLKFLFSRFWKLDSPDPRSRCGQGGCPLRPLSMANSHLVTGLSQGLFSVWQPWGLFLFS